MSKESIDTRILEELANSNSKEKIAALLKDRNYSSSTQNLIYKISNKSKQNVVDTSYESRLIEMQMVLMNYAQHNFDSEVAISSERDIFDALALTINITGEELQDSYEQILQQERAIKGKTNDLIEANRDLEESLEKQLFLKQELHHRVKNNLQFIAGLLILEVQGLDNPELERILLEVQTKIISISKLHDIMLKSGTTDKVEFNSYVTNVGEMLVSTSGLKGLVNISGDQFHMRIESASRLAIVLNEIITNSIKYSWEPKLENQINIKLVSTPSHLELHYSEGESNFDFVYVKKGMGSKLYEMILINQLRAKKETCHSHSNCYVFSIPKSLVD